MKKIVTALLSIFLLASCSVSKTPSLEAQLANDYNFVPYNVNLEDYESQYARSIKSSFLILNCKLTNSGPRIDSTGSGFAYKENPDGSYFIITNNHVVKGSQALFAVSHTGQIVEAELVGIGGNYLDIGVIRIPHMEEIEVAPLYMDGDVNNMPYLTKGQEIYALGTPSSINLFGTVTRGVVANDKRVILNTQYSNLTSDSHAIQIDVPINPGNSGGPLFNMDGEVIGVNTFKLVRDNLGHNLTGVNFALPIHDMIIAADDIINNAVIVNGHVRKLGLFKPRTFGGSSSFINVEDLTIAQREALQLDDSILKGAFVRASTNLTLEKGKIVVEFNGKPIEDIVDLRRGLFETKEYTASGKVMDNLGNITDVTFKLS